MRRLLAAAAAVVICLAAAGCTTQKRQTLTVLAASSLNGTFTELKSVYENEHPDVAVKLVFDSSATLAQMAEQGAPGDVLATADQRTMDAAVAKSAVRRPTQFASNVMVLIVPSDNPGNIASFADLAHTSFLTCVPTAPCGALAETLLKGANIKKPPVSQEVDVKSVLAKVSSDEADAGLVYATDAIAAGDDVEAIDIPGADETPTTYWIAVTRNARSNQLARDWVSLVNGTTGQKVLQRAGFGEP